MPTSYPLLLSTVPRPDSYGTLTHYWEADSGVIASGGSISQWNDLTGNSNLLQANAGQQPALISGGGTRGHNCVRFSNASSTQMVQNTGGFLADKAAFTAISIVKLRGAPGNAPPGTHMICNSGDNSGFSVLAIARSGLTLIDSGTGNNTGDFFVRGRRNSTDTGVNCRSDTISQDTWLMFSGVYDYANQTLESYLNATQLRSFNAMGTPGNSNNSTAWQIFVGGNNNNYANIDLMALYFFTSRLTSVTIARFYNEFARPVWLLP